MRMTSEPGSSAAIATTVRRRLAAERCIHDEEEDNVTMGMAAVLMCDEADRGSQATTSPTGVWK